MVCLEPSSQFGTPGGLHARLDGADVGIRNWEAFADSLELAAAVAHEGRRHPATNSLSCVLPRIKVRAGRVAPCLGTF